MTNADPDAASHSPDSPRTRSQGATGADPSHRAGTPRDEHPFDEGSFDERSFDEADAFSEAHFALELSKEWVRQHQTVAMLGAFAVGAFVGALLRD